MSAAFVPVEVADPAVFLAIDDLDLVGRGLADAVWLGRHPGVRRGAGIEFHCHRPYESGDDVRRVNWTLFARHRRLFTRESRQDSLRPVHILIDATGSMGVAHGPPSKFRYAAAVAAGLAHLAARQGDAPSLGVVQANLLRALPPRTGLRHAMAICARLSATEPGGVGDVSRAMSEARDLCRSRGFVVLISDFFDKEPILILELAQLRSQGHDLLALQILDPVEVELPISGDYDFIDIETADRLRLSTEDLHDAHARSVRNWRTGLRTACLSAGVRWESATTTEPLVPLLRRWLHE